MKEEKEKIQWHPAFAAAMELEFLQDRDGLEFQREHTLNTKPLLIDLLIIKRNKEKPLENDMGKLFRKYNILEYKSPDDSFGIDDWHKVVTYAGLFKAYGETENAITVEDVTITVIRESKPEKLFRHLEEQGCHMRKAFDGIYYVEGHMYYAAQIIVARELDRETYVWLRALSGKMEEKDMRELLQRASRLTGKHDKEMADSVMDVSMKANRDVIEKMMGDEHMYEVLMELMEPKIQEREQWAARQTAERMLRKGKVPLEDIAEYSGLSIEAVRQMKTEIQ